MKTCTNTERKVDELKLDSRYLAWIRADAKTMTTRRGLLHVRVGSTLSLRSSDAAVDVIVTGVHFRTLESLTTRDSDREGFGGVEELQAALRHHYPDLTAGDLLTCIQFERTEP